MKRYVIIIIGQVQNVGFRFLAKEKAKELRLNGLVRNQDDGSVYVEAEGSEVALREFIEWCSTGPRSARVRKVRYQSFDDSKHFNGFAIL